MVIYEVKVKCLQTGEVIYVALDKKPLLPSRDFLEQHPIHILLIRTIDSSSAPAGDAGKRTKDAA
jgi:hypothetical protein